MGKTLMSLVWAQNVVEQTNGRVLILTPLAVGMQFVDEGQRFGIPIRQSRDGSLDATRISVSNYEQLHRFDPADFSGVECDECFIAGTPVDTPRGPRAIEGFRPGDSVLNATGVDRVVATRQRELTALVRVTTDDGNTIYSSEGHPFF